MNLFADEVIPCIEPADHPAPAMKTAAVLSECGTYRYRLTRVWADDARVLWIMANPSTADASADDPTIRRCIRFASDWGYGGIEVVNLYALRATDPKELRKHPQPEGPENYRHVDEAIRDPENTLIVCAWGGVGLIEGRGNDMLRRIDSMGYTPYVLKRTGSDGQPWHPLYLLASLTPFPCALEAS